MYAKIIPLAKLSRQIGIFDYIIPPQLEKKISPGQLVEIPFRNQLLNGIIFSLHTSPPDIKLKEIIRISDKEPFLKATQLELIKWVSFYYCSSPALLLKAVVPYPPKKRLIKKNLFDHIGYEKMTVLKSDIPNIRKILREIEGKNKILFQWDNYKNKIAIYLKLIEKYSDKKQVLLIFPQLNNIKEFMPYIPIHLRDKIAILHSELNAQTHWQEWDKIRIRSCGLIFGTRQAIFSPVNNLGLIIIDREENPSHKQWDQNPRYHALDVAIKLAALTKAKILISSNMPRSETYHMAKSLADYKIIEERPLAANYVKFVNMQNEWKNKHYSIYSEEAIDSLKETLANKQLPIIYINRRGSSTFALCKDCGYTPQCPNCKISLSLHKASQNTFHLTCHHCNYTQKLAVPCPKCKSPRIKFAGTGTEKAEDEIKKIFPAAKIKHIDLDTKKNVGNLKDCEILIGTKALIEYPLPKIPELVIFLNIDTDLGVPSFKAFESTLQAISYFKMLLNQRASENNKILIQTYSAKNPLLDLSQYYPEELARRNKLNYPPFSQLIKLTYKNKNSNMIKIETDKIFNLLLENFRQNPNISILGPNFLPVMHNKYAAQIIIKNHGPKDSLQEWLIKNIPAECIIDIDPIEI